MSSPFSPSSDVVILLDDQQERDLVALQAMRAWWHLRNIVVRSERAKRRGRT